MRAASLIITLLLTSAAVGQALDASFDEAFDAMKKRNVAERDAAAGHADRRAWDYVFADKKTGVVTVLACASLIQPNDPVEFFVCTAASGRYYESLAVTLAKPSDIKAAMQFVGLAAGAPVDFDKDRYWPRGQRVMLRFDAGGRSSRAEELVLDTHTKKSLPPTGLVFAGSFERRDEAGPARLAADFADAQPIAPLYSNPAALLDLPRQATQTAVYGTQKPSAAAGFKPGDRIDITLTAATGADKVDEYAAAITVGLNDGKVTDGKPRFGLDVFPLNGRAKRDPGPPTDDLPKLVASLAGWADGTRDVFTTVRVADAVPVTDVRRLFTVLRALEKDRGVKLDPLPGQLFFRAYFPDPAWRDRATRLGEPWELFLLRNADRTLAAKLERAVDNPDAAATDAKIVESTTPAGPAAFAAHVNANASQWSSTIFVYPPPDLTYGELMTWVRPVLTTYPRVFVYPAEPAATQPK